MNRDKAIIQSIRHLEHLAKLIVQHEDRTEVMDAGRRCTFRAVECLLLEIGVDPNYIPDYPMLLEPHKLNFERRKAEKMAEKALKSAQ